MSDEVRVRYLFVNMKLSKYIAISAITVAATTAGAVVTYLTLRNSPLWPLTKIWMVLASAVPCLILEAWIAVRRAKREAGQQL